MKDPESPLVNTDPDILEKKSGGGCVSLMGLLFLLPGLFVMPFPLGRVPVDTDGARRPFPGLSRLSFPHHRDHRRLHLSPDH